MDGPAGCQTCFAAIRPVGVRGGAVHVRRQPPAASNTHKGAIFSLGILAAASGHCRKRCGRFLPETILSPVRGHGS